MKISKINEFGRSMVEMLGVLAIIGVLSVGAIAGYSKAMMKYKLNKQAQQLSDLLNVLYRYKASWGKNPEPMLLIPYFVKLNEIPKEMITNSNEYIKDVFNSKIELATNDCYENGCETVRLSYSLQTQSSFDKCQNIFNVAKNFQEQLQRMNLGITTESNTTKYSTEFFGKKYCTNGIKCIKDLTLDDIHNLCIEYCAETYKNCKSHFIFKIND